MDLEVVITAQLFGLADLPDRYFAWYRERFLANEREALIVALSDLYHDHAGSVISRMEFTESLQESLGTKLAPFFQHWFDQPGFQPIYRADTT
jgi:hypothetical protein